MPFTLKITSFSAALTFLLSTQAYAYTNWTEANQIAPGAPVRAAGIVELRTAIENLKTDLDAGNITGNLTVPGDLFVNGATISGDGKQMIRFSDSWLRLNPAGNFTSGVYTPSNFVTAGNVGIGTNAPAQPLDVAGNARINAGGNWSFLNLGSEVYDRLYADNSAGKGYGGGLWFRIGNAAGTGYTDSLRMAENGNVGIGTNPTQRLHVAGNSYLQGTLYLGSTDTALFRDAANRIATDDQLYVRPASPNTYLYSTNTYLGNTSGDTTHLRGNTFRWNQGIIQGNGNVGIGVDVPLRKFHVAGHMLAGDRIYLKNNSNFIDTPTGNYGSIQINGGGSGNWEGYSINGNFVFMNNDGGANAQMGLYNDLDNRWVMLHQRDNFTRLYQPNNGNVRFQIHSNGRVGIGGSGAPSQELEVFGDVAAQRYCDENGGNCWDASAGWAFAYTPGLSVFSALSNGFANSTGAGNFGVGLLSAARLTTGTHNITIGDESGGFLDNDSGNVFIGHRAGRMEGFGFNVNNNTAIGRQAGFNNPSNLVNATAIGNDTPFAASNTVRIGNNAITNNYFNGNVHAASFLYTSDRKLKEKVITLDGLDLIQQLRGVSFVWKKDGTKSVGLIAQEVEAVLPEIVSTDYEGVKQVSYAHLVAPLIEAVKEQQLKIEALEFETQNLRSELEQLSSNQK